MDSQNEEKLLSDAMKLRDIADKLQREGKHLEAAKAYEETASAYAKAGSTSNKWKELAVSNRLKAKDKEREEAAEKFEKASFAVLQRAGELRDAKKYVEASELFDKLDNGFSDFSEVSDHYAAAAKSARNMSKMMMEFERRKQSDDKLRGALGKSAAKAWAASKTSGKK